MKVKINDYLHKQVNQFSFSEQHLKFQSVHNIKQLNVSFLDPEMFLMYGTMSQDSSKCLRFRRKESQTTFKSVRKDYCRTIPLIYLAQILLPYALLKYHFDHCRHAPHLKPDLR